jgi:hypothetical protein
MSLLLCTEIKVISMCLCVTLINLFVYDSDIFIFECGSDLVVFVGDYDFFWFVFDSDLGVFVCDIV